MSEEDQVLLQQKREEERERAVLRSAPGQLVSAVATRVLDDGIVKFYCRVSEGSFTNASGFLVAAPSGVISYHDANGGLLATVPFSCAGDVPRGGSAILAVQTADAPGKCASSRMEVTSVTMR